MTFPSRLTELLEKATRLPWIWDGNQLWHQGVDYTDKDDPHLFTGLENDRRLDKSPSLQNNKDLIAYLVNHAEAIRDLVVAAEKVHINETVGEPYSPDAIEKLGEALAKLEEA